ncbi:MAG: hypothetical protein ACRD8O_10380, partial [Bryobacteraceae bacterium]
QIMGFGTDREDFSRLPGVTLADLLTKTPCDHNGDGIVDVNDTNVIAYSLKSFVVTGDPRDPNGDHKVDASDLRICVERCAGPGCGPPR